MTEQTEETSTNARMTWEDFEASLTGVEEENFEAHWGTSLEGLLRDVRARGLMKLSRAVLFTFKIREGMAPAEAKAFVQGLTRAQMNEESGKHLMSPEQANADEIANWEAPATEAGKDEPAS